MQKTTIIDENGRILIPSIFRNNNSWQKGLKLTLIQDQEGVVKLVSKRKKIAQAQQKFLENMANLPSVDNFLEFRKQEGELENKKMQKYDK